MKRTSLFFIVVLIICTLTSCQNTSQPIDVGNDEPQKPIIEPQPIVEKEPELPGAFFVMVDDHPNARPQLNLEKADIVYEMICEWTITRYMAGFYKTDPKVVGPVRSARYYYAQAVLPYDTLYIHVGGNMDALKMIDDLNIKDMCDITNASGYYMRSKDRRPPHNAYIKTESLLKYASKNNYELKPLPKLEIGQLTGGKDITDFEIVYGTEKYPHTVKWIYDMETDRYVRYLNGEKFVTASNNNLYADNLVIIEAATKLVNVPVDYKQSEMNIIGKGKALFLRNGKMFSGYWIKDSAKDHFTYLLEDGRKLLYGPGNVWVQQVHSIDERTVATLNISQK